MLRKGSRWDNERQEEKGVPWERARFQGSSAGSTGKLLAGKPGGVGAHTGCDTSVFSHSTRVFGNGTSKRICSFTPLGKPAAAPPAAAASSCLQLAPSGCRGRGDSERVGGSTLQGGLGVTGSCGEGRCGSGDLRRAGSAGGAARALLPARL